MKNEYTREFEYYFWSVYPKKVGKYEAFVRWQDLELTNDEMHEIYKHLVERSKKDKKWIPNENGATFIVDPCRFLKYRRWEDQYEKISQYSPLKRAYDVEPEPSPTLPRNPEIARRALEEAKNAVRH